MDKMKMKEKIMNKINENKTDSVKPNPVTRTKLTNMSNRLDKLESKENPVAKVREIKKPSVRKSPALKKKSKTNWTSLGFKIIIGLGIGYGIMQILKWRGKNGESN